MTWLPALATAGCVLALGPIIIHLIFRRRYRTVEFAAMRFLLDSMRRTRQRLRLEELIMILLRVLICVLAGVTLANIRAGSLLPGGEAPTAHVFVLDDSLSMGQQVGTSTLFAKATAHLAETLRQLDDADMVAVISACRPESGKPLGELTLVGELDRDDLVRRVTSLRPTDLRAKLPDALALAHKLLAERKDMLGRLYVIGDFRRSDLTGAGRGDTLRKAFAALAEAQAELTLLDFGLPCAGNLTVEKLAPARQFVVAGRPAPLRLVVRNNGTRAAEGVKAVTSVGKTTLPALPLPALEPGESATVEFDFVFERPGSAAVEAALPCDALSGDDRAAVALDVREAMRVLIVDGSPDPSRPTSGSFCLAYALDPSRSGKFGRRVEVVRPDAMPADLDDYDVIFLTNVRQFASAPGDDGRPTWPQWEALEGYVRRGGGLGIFLGDRVSRDFYNGPAWRKGSGLNPYRLAGAPPAKVDQGQFVRLRPDRIAEEPMLRLFRAGGGAWTRQVRFYAHLPVEASLSGPPDEGVGPARVLASFDDAAASPAVVQRSFGRGSVVVWYTAADKTWSNWPKTVTMLPVVNDMAWSLARRTDDGLDGPVGQRIAYVAGAALADATSVTLKTPAYPDEDLQLLRPTRRAGQMLLEYPGARHAGLYEMEFTLADRTKRTVLFSRHVDPDEARLDKASRDEIKAAVAQSFDYHGNLAEESFTQADHTSRKAYWQVLLALLLAVMATESYLGRRFGHHALHREARHAS